LGRDRAVRGADPAQAERFPAFARGHQAARHHRGRHRSRREDRERFDALLTKLSLKRPRAGIARSIEEARKIVTRSAFRCWAPSYVLGGRAM